MAMIWEWPHCRTVAWDASTTIAPYDGDTFRCRVDQGRGTIWEKGTIRLAHIDTPELRAELEDERMRARAARDYLATLLPIGTAVHLLSVGYDKYNDRCDAIVIRLPDGLNINEAMVQAGHATYVNYR